MSGGRVKGRIRTVVVAGLAGLTLTAAQAPETADPDDTITVTGARRDPAEVRREAVEFVRQTGMTANGRPAARWVDPVCPRAFGLAPAHARVVESKMRDIAKAAGVPLARESCRANIAVTFTADAGAMVRKIAARAPKRLHWVTPAERSALFEGSAPIRWWYANDTRGGDGRGATNAPAPWTGGNAEGGGSVLPTGSEQPTLQQYSSSLVSTQAIRAITNATVVVDVQRSEGVPLEAVAAYAAMVAFAEVRGAGGTPAGSILSLFDAGAEPLRDLTERDAALLKSLYDLPLDRRAGEHRRRLVRDLIAAETDG